MNFYMDLHIHIGRTKSGRPVKITASNKLTLQAVIEESINRKGLDIIGIIDAHSPEVIEEIRELITSGLAEELAEGGIKYKEQLTIILGTELEVLDENCQGPIHVLCFFPTLDLMDQFSKWCEKRLKNIQLSSQRIYVSGRELQYKVKELSGLFIPAHVFTPFKSLYGKGVYVSLEEVFDPNLIDAIELGLSSDTTMAEKLPELNNYTFLSNSDAHSVTKIAREHQIIVLLKPSFLEIDKALKEQGGRRIKRNVGLHPKLGKYYQTVCSICFAPFQNGICSNGHKGKSIKGVAERIEELSFKQRNELTTYKRKRPPYLHQIPLEFIPGCGPKTLERLLEEFRTEMVVLHEAADVALFNVVPEKVAVKIVEARKGDVNIQTGGGGIYGKIK
ncbi:endonuclease Q family protein [Evansella vedderi]|nr:endonuclease Q family protein [Evansella vedderi]